MRASATCTVTRIRQSVATWVVVGSVLLGGAASAAAFRYKDANGQWVYTDRPPPAGAVSQSVDLGGSGGASPRMSVVARATATGVSLVAVNECACTVEFAIKVGSGAAEKLERSTVPGKSERVVLELPAASGLSGTRFEYGYVIGAPGAQHRPPQPYRAPFGLAQSFEVTQAPPDALTHRDAASRNAIDVALPVGTPIHAAREGVVINVAARYFRGGLTPQDLNDANFVQVMHDDGTHAIYAHLQLDTVRVRPGQRVARGEYIANSGNTGFSSGPHLHFVVLRNVGLRSESVPVVFAGPGGVTVKPRSGQELTAY